MSKEMTMVKLNNRKELQLKALDTLKSLSTNPVAEILIAFLIIESLQKYGMLDERIFQLPFPFQGVSVNIGDAMELLISQAVILQQLSPILPSLISAGGDLVGSLTKGISGLIPIAGAL